MNLIMGAASGQYAPSWVNVLMKRTAWRHNQIYIVPTSDKNVNTNLLFPSVFVLYAAGNYLNFGTRQTNFKFKFER